MPKKSHVTRIILITFLALILGFCGYKYFGIDDIIKGSSFVPTAEMSDLISEIKLTPTGERILKATHPILEEAASFNVSCDSHDADLYVLGCYYDHSDAVHLYNVNNKDLTGVKQSTLSHEFLHAVWARLPFWEQLSLESAMMEYYNSLPQDDELKDILSNYNQELFYSELHSRLGTQYKNLPENLEKHYAKYFTDQDKIVAFYEKYSGTYKRIKKEQEELKAKIDKLSPILDADIKALEADTDDLNARVLAHNKNKDIYESGQDIGMTIFDINSEAASLNNEAATIRNRYDELLKRIAEFNNIVTEYNSKVIKGNDLIKSINSNLVESDNAD